VKFGLQLHADRGADAVLREAQLADAQGFDSVWTGDHLFATRGEPFADRPLETWTLMTAIGATTQRVRLAFATLNPSFRNPALLAKMLATLDQITHGRVICTLGAGWFEGEYRAYDIPFIEDHDVRIDHEREVAQLFKQLWTHPAPERITFEGSYVTVREHLAERFAEMDTWGVNYVRLTFSDAAQQTYFAERVLPHLGGVQEPITAG
jgi:dimethylsulfone monooxygenase